MARLITDPAYSLRDFRILPGYTDNNSRIQDIALRSPLCRRGKCFIYLELPFMSAAMQAVTGADMAIALAELGGIGVLPVCPEIEEQRRKIWAVKHYKAGFQDDIITFSPSTILKHVKETIDKTRYSIFPVTDTGVFHGKLVGVITDKDFDPRSDLGLSVNERMRKDIRSGVDVEDLREANRLMILYGHGFLPIVSREGTLQSVVFKKDLDKHIKHPHATVDGQKRLRVGLAISTHPEDREQVTALVDSEVDLLVIDSSDGFSVFQKETVEWIKKKFDVPVIGGNVVTAEAFQMLADAGADGVKVGMGIGSGCTTQEVRATGRGQATALLEVVKARDAYAREGRYIPIVADGGISAPVDIAIALALGANTVMMGNFFARFSESPSMVYQMNGKPVKEYWMEGSTKGRNYHRYGQLPDTFFEEGIMGFVPHLGSIYDHLPLSGERLKATLRTVGVSTIDDFQKHAVLELQSDSANRDSQVHDMIPSTPDPLSHNRPGLPDSVVEGFDGETKYL